jgi:Ca2+/Na+ antiporter
MKSALSYHGVSTTNGISGQWLFEPARWGLSPAVMVILAVGLTLRVLWAIVHPVEPISDFAHYHQLATTLSEHGVYGLDPDTPDALRPPGWPVVLAGLYGLVGSDPEMGAVLGTVLEWGAIVLAAVAASRLLRPEFAVGAVAAMCLYPAGLAYGAVLGSEHLTALLFTGLVVLVAFAQPSMPTALGAGLLTAALLLTRAEYGIAMILIVAVWLVRGASLRRVAALATVALAGALVFLGPWIARNAARFDEFIPTSANGGVVFYRGTLAVRRTKPPIVYRLYNAGGSPKAIDNRLWRWGLENVAEDPLRWLKFDVQRIYVQYGSDASPLQWGEIDALGARIVARLYLLALMGFALVGFATVVVRWHHLPPPWLTIVASILAVSLLKTFFIVHQRDRIPLMYLLIVVAALGVQQIAENRHGLLSRPRSSIRDPTRIAEGTP